MEQTPLIYAGCESGRMHGVTESIALKGGAHDCATAVAAEGIVQVPDEVVPVVSGHGHEGAAHEYELHLRPTTRYSPLVFGFSICAWRPRSGCCLIVVALFFVRLANRNVPMPCKHA